MAGLGETLAGLRALRPNGSERLTAFGDGPQGPGALNGWYYVPEGVAAPPLVVVLHGCTQNAAGYDRGSGWSALAERHGFAVLYPEQTRGNNPNLCFNWFQPEDTRRGGGEAASIRGMIARMADEHGVDASRVFVTGLSAGGAMTSVMLACYPEIFAGGAIIAGLPFAAAQGVPEALERMRGQGHGTPAEYGAAVKRASPHRGKWPTVSVWHGTADATVHPDNAALILAQWRGVHELGAQPDVDERIDGQRHRAWRGEDGRVLVEEFSIAGMAHGTPLAVSGPRAAGVAGPFMLEAGISSTWHVAAAWGLIDETAQAAFAGAPPAAGNAAHGRAQPGAAIAEALGKVPAGVGETIEAALRSAGLMR